MLYGFVPVKMNNNENEPSTSQSVIESLQDKIRSLERSVGTVYYGMHEVAMWLEKAGGTEVLHMC